MLKLRLEVLEADCKRNKAKFMKSMVLLSFRTSPFGSLFIRKTRRELSEQRKVIFNGFSFEESTVKFFSTPMICKGFETNGI